MALERFFKDLCNGHEFFIGEAFGLATTSKTNCPEFYVATVRCSSCVTHIESSSLASDELGKTTIPPLGPSKDYPDSLVSDPS